MNNKKAGSIEKSLPDFSFLENLAEEFMSSKKTIMEKHNKEEEAKDRKAVVPTLPQP